MVFELDYDINARVRYNRFRIRSLEAVSFEHFELTFGKPGFHQAILNAFVSELNQHGNAVGQFAYAVVTYMRIDNHREERWVSPFVAEGRGFPPLTYQLPPVEDWRGFIVGEMNETAECLRAND